MEANEAHELQEHAEHGAHEASMRPVAFTMAVLAVLVATVSLMGHRTHTEEIILQNKVTDQWAYYQAKNLRLHTDELFADLSALVTTRDAEATGKFEEKTRAEVERYKEDKKEVETKAHELEAEFALTQRKTNRFDLGEVFLEVALVITSITLLSGRRIFWHLGLLTAIAGVAVAASVWFMQ